MAETKIGICRDVTPTSTGSQTFLLPDLHGETPIAVWFEWTCATTTAAATDHAVIGFGAATGTSAEWACCIGSENGVSPSETYKRSTTSGCIMILDATDGTVDGQAELTGFGGGSVTINWTTAPSSQYIIVCKAFYCNNAFAGTFALSGTENTTTDNTAPGFAGNIMYLASVFQNSNNYTQTYGNISYGYATTASQGAMFYREDSGATTQNCIAYLSNQYAAIAAGYSGFSYGVEISDWDASGFSHTPRDGAAAVNIGYLLLDIDEGVYGGTYALPAVTGDDAHTGVGFTPQFITGGVSQLTAVNTYRNNAEAGAFGTLTVNENYQYSFAVNGDDGNAVPTDTQSLADNRAINLPQDDGSTGYKADFVSFDPDGWTWGIADAMSTATYGWITAIESAGTTIPAKQNLYRRLR